MALFVGTDEVVRFDLQVGPRFLEAGAHPLDVRLRRFLQLLRRTLGLLAVLVRAGEHPRVAPANERVATERVGGDRGVRAPEVRNVVDVVDGRGDVKGARGHGATHVTRLKARVT